MKMKAESEVVKCCKLTLRIGRGREPRKAGKGKVNVFSPRASGGWQGGPARILVLFQ